MSSRDPGFASDSTRALSWIANVSSLILSVGLALYAWRDPPGFALLLARDSLEGSGWVEHFTVIVLVPGILAGLYAFSRFRHRLPSRMLGYWLLAWVLACIYFAGEEASWGQWYFQWETPEFFAERNRQKEINLHNTSTWLNEKPRLLVELFIFVAGFMIPLWRALGNRPIIRRGFLAEWEGWICAPLACVSAAGFFVIVRFAKWLPQIAPQGFGQSELREFCVAWFLMWYLISFLVRLARNPAPLDAKPHALQHE